MNFLFKTLNCGRIPGTNSILLLHPTLFLLIILTGIVSIPDGIVESILNMAFICMLYFYVLLHEIGHVKVLEFWGLSSDKITLFIFGGAANTGPGVELILAKNPLKEFTVAIAGPIVSVALAIFFGIIAWNTVPLEGERGLVFQLATASSFINLVIAAFNMLPAYPMDGGRMLRAILGMFGMHWYPASILTCKIAIVLYVIMFIAGIWWLNIGLILISVVLGFGAYMSIGVFHKMAEEEFHSIVSKMRSSS